jgi:hypothetical protein
MTQGSKYSMPISIVDDVTCRAIPNRDFDPAATFRRLPASQLRKVVDVGLSPELLRELKVAVLARIESNPADLTELESLLELLSRS